MGELKQQDAASNTATHGDQSPSSQSAVFVGEESLVLRCAEEWASQGNDVVLVASDVPAIREGCIEGGFENISIEEFKSFTRDYDYLFSVVNSHILPDEILALARHDAINFHDGPLPRYAGLNATNWAILNGEETHGVTWHLMVEEIDAGAVVNQRVVPVKAEDTALTLNARCHEEALLGFSALAQSLATGSLNPIPQDLTQRTYFGGSMKPAAAGLINWEAPRLEIDRLLRALDFGPYANPLAKPKIRLSQTEVHIVDLASSTYAVAGKPVELAGTILASSADGVVVACSDGSVTLARLADRNGTVTPADVVFAGLGLVPGMRLPPLEDALATSLADKASSLARHEGFWAPRLSALDPIDLPYRHDAGPVLSAAERAARPLHNVTSTIPDTVRASLFAEAEPARVLSAGLCALLRITSGRSDFDIGFRVGDAVVPDTLSPFFATVVPLHVSLADGQPFSALVTDMAKEMASLDRRATFAADLAARTPSLAAGLGLPDHEVGLEISAATHDPTPDLPLTVRIAPDGETVSWFYDPEVLSHQELARIVEQFELLLDGVAANPACPIDQIDVLPADERRYLLEELRGDAGGRPVGDMVTRWAERVAKAPTAIAVTSPSGSLSYGDLDAQSDLIARHLRQRSVVSGTFVGILLHRSLDMCAAVLGVLKAGAAYLPLDPDYPVERLQHMLTESEARVVLSTTALLDTPAADAIDTLSSVETLTIDALGAPGETETTLPTVAPDSPAYAIYTSGSTGTPKGVVVTHGSLVNHADAVGATYQLTPDDRVLQFASLSFDVAAEELFPTWLAGGTVVLRNEALVSDFVEMQRFIVDNALTVLNLPATYWALWVDHLSSANPAGLPKSLRLVVAGSESVSSDQLEQWQAIVPDSVRWLNAYGPTEGTITATIFDPEKSDAAIGPVVPIGRPISNVSLLVLNAARQPVPLGVAGELYIGGRGVAAGYLNQPSLTAERFVPDPFGSNPGDRLYRTGDLARWLPDGNLEFLGRGDDQVKIRGFRIELGEIEQSLARHANVRQAVVVTNGTGIDSRLVAYVRTDTKAAPLDSADYSEFLAKLLPPYMVPSAFVEVDEYPQTPNSKVDRKELGRRAVQVDHVVESEPQTAGEHLVADIWCEVLGTSSVGLEQNFFDMGGHSLLATQILSRFHARTGIKLSLADFFASPTVGQMADHVGSDPERPTNQPPEIKVLPRGQSFPLSSAQARMWFINELSPGNAAYYVKDSYEAAGPFDIEWFAQSVEVLIERHESLRTLFRNSDQGPIQDIVDPFEVDRSVIDLSHLQGEDQDAALQKLMATELVEPFNFETAPAWRFRVARLAPERHAVLTAMHHVIFDQWSAGLFFTEILSVYGSLSRGEAVDLPPLGPQYADFAVWQRNLIERGELDSELEYWRSQLTGLPTISFPVDHARPPVQQHQGAMVRSVIKPELATAVRDRCAEQQVTPFMFLFAAAALLIQKYTRQSDLPFGMPVANRHRLAVENIMGTFVNTLVMRCDLDGNPTFAGLLDRVKDTALDAYAHQEIPFERLVEEFANDRDLSRQPLFQIMINILNAPYDLGKLGTAEISEIVPERFTSQVDFSINAIFDDYDVYEPAVELEYSTALFDAETMEGLLDRFLRLLAAVAENPDLLLSDYSILSDEDHAELDEGWNQTEREYRTDACVHTLVSEQAARTPDRTALVSDDRSLTYAELDEASNQLARYLRTRGVEAGTVVGLYLHRGIEMVIGQLGILKAGAAYLPLDPSFPTDRLGYMVEDSSAPLLISEEALQDHLPGGGGTEVIWIDSDWSAISAESAEPVTSEVTSRDLMYLIYTSGSTGKPKGVALEHRGVTNFLTTMAEKPGISSDDTLLSVTTLSFDISVLEIFLPLITGAKLVIASRNAAADGSAIAALLEREAVTVMQATPATWSMLIDVGWEGSPQLTKVLCGGEALARDLANRILERVPELWNMYGPTETTIWSAVERIEKGEKPITIGSPIANTTFHIVDDLCRRVPVGVPGELLIGGDGLAREYRNRPELTAEKFIPDTLGPDPDQRLYRTGDLARFRPDGSVEFMGRIDSQVKVRGFRIELGEIENAMGSHSSLREAVVVARPSQSGDNRLVAYYLLQKGSVDLSFSDWRDYLRTDLPDYMIPSAFVALDEFPMTPNKKVDRNALPEPPDDHGSEVAYVPPSGETQEHLVEIWQRVLARDQIGVQDDFFAIGGHSLLAVRIFAAIQKEMGAELELSVMFANTTVESLAPLVEAARGGEHPGEGRGHSYTNLIELCDGGPGILPFFCVHGAGGQVLFMQAWKQYMKPIPLVGLQAVGFDGVHDLHGSIEEMAASYVSELVRYQPEGPVYVGGYSGGGSVALEMARQLEALGREVGVVVLIDTYHPSVEPKRISAAERLVSWTKSPVAHVRKVYRTRIAWTLTKLRNDRTQQSDELQAIPLDEREFYMFEHMEDLIFGYKPDPYDGPVLLLSSADEWSLFNDVKPHRGWDETLAKLIVQEVPGNHRTAVLEPHASETITTIVNGLIHAGIHVGHGAGQRQS